MYTIVNTSTGGSCVRLEIENGVVLLIPENPENTDYQRYLEWLAAGNEPEIV